MRQDHGRIHFSKGTLKNSIEDFVLPFYGGGSQRQASKAPFYGVGHIRLQDETIGRSTN